MSNVVSLVIGNFFVVEKPAEIDQDTASRIGIHIMCLTGKHEWQKLVQGKGYLK